MAKCPLPTPVSPVIKMVQWRFAARSASCNHKGIRIESLDSSVGDLDLPKPGAGGLLAISFSLFPPLGADGTTAGISIPIGQATNHERVLPSLLPTPECFGGVSHGKKAYCIACQVDCGGSLSFRAADVGPTWPRSLLNDECSP